MPKAKISHVLSFSSEDPSYPVSNILNNDSAKEWKTKSIGEDTATVVLQLEKASTISGIDIGNAHSAFIEVLVRRSSNPHEYKVLLATSSFMTASESRQSANVNKVRMFKQEDFDESARNEKWDCVKFVCKQPYNRHVQYGLSFVTISITEDSTGGPSGIAHLGKFTLRPPSPDVISAGSLFQRRKEFDNKLSAATEIRQANDLASTSTSSGHKEKIKETLLAIPKCRTPVKDATTKPRNSGDVMYTKDDDKPNDKIDKIIKRKRKEEKEKEEKLEKENKVTKRKQIDRDEPKPSTSKEPTKKKKKVPKIDKLVPTHPMKPFKQLLSGVVFVISGIQNPERADLRSKGLQLGAKYSADWKNGCTHLICAFPNTPKFNQVRGKGKIVNKSWISECFKERKRLPWRRFALDGKDQMGNESEDEIWEETAKAETKTSTVANISDGSGADTDDEIERIQNAQTTQDNGIFEVDTEEEEFALVSPSHTTCPSNPHCRG